MRIQLNCRTEQIFKETLVAEFDYQVRISSNEETGSAYLPLHQEVAELTRVTENYDRLAVARKSLETRSDQIKSTLAKSEFSSYEHLIIGAGDTGTSLWLQSQESETLMLCNDTGNWQHDYILAQPHNLIERVDVHSDPKDFTTKKRYQENAYVNARHLFQANMINLSETQAPLALGIDVKQVEKKENHPEWKDPNCQYRVKVKINQIEKEIYTNRIDLCTGLGKARNIRDGNIIAQDLLPQLSVPDPQTGLPPLVNGNDFLLSAQKEKMRDKKIVIYGGGGTATACFRKAFYGTGITSDHNTYQNVESANEVVWFYQSTLNYSGQGKKASETIEGAGSRLISGNLRQILYDSNSKKMRVQFLLTQGSYYEKSFTNDLKKLTKVNGTHEFVERNGDVKQDEEWFEVECDQFVGCMGGDTSDLELLCSEFKADLSIKSSENGHPEGLATSNGQIRIFGAAAVSLGRNQFQETTREWILANQFSRDGEWPGVMPITRSQIKMTSRAFNSVNINTDEITMVEAFLKNTAVPEPSIQQFIRALLDQRKINHSGIQKNELQTLLTQCSLNRYVEIAGHGCLKKKFKP